ncbi:MAG: ArsR family transcriptional regulator [Trichormus sp. ATA11-4-KO1]|jgi:predicted transcriptional regulator|nr:ArsR family transcriptional regulator [Trichormus sp. ATA11-4-KO1]
MNQDFEESSEQKSLADVMDLPDEQRQVVNWIIRQKRVTLLEVISHTNLAEEVVQNCLQSLLSQGFIQELNDSEAIYYQPRLIDQKQSRLPPNIWDKL